MDNEMKRRVFLTAIVGTLIGVPVGVRLLTGKRDGAPSHTFSKELKKYQKLAEVTVAETTGASPFTLPLAPPVGGECQYLLLSTTFLPNDLSQAVGHDPDAFFVREGVLFFDKTQPGQVVITGGDTVSGVYSPTGTEEKEKKSVTLFVKDGGLKPARVQGQASDPNSDRQMLHLLALECPKAVVAKGLSIGSKWKNPIGRVKPFTGLPTDYEVAGFAEIAGQKTVKIAFSGKIGNILQLPGVNEAKPEKGAVSSLQYDGNAWFDLDSGLLVRQETQLESQNTGIKGYGGPNGSGDLTIKSNLVVQLFFA